MIDVSAYQGTVDWQKVYDAGTRHAYVKLTEGLTHIDTAGRRNVMGAAAAGLTVGVYHYAHPSNPPHREAAFFLKHAAPLMHPGHLRPALDLEVTERHSWAFLNDWKAQWFAVVDAHIGAHAVFYSYFYFWKQMHLFADRPVWGAATGAAFQPPASWTMHQYSFTGSVPGVNGKVDLSRRLAPHDWPLIPT